MKNHILSLFFVLSACTSYERLRPDVEARPIPSRLDEIALINELRVPYAYGGVNCFDGTGLRRFNPHLSQGYNDHDAHQDQTTTSTCVSFRSTGEDQHPDSEIRRYVEAGFGLSDIYCQRFFVVAAQSALSRRFLRNTGTAVDALVGTVLSLAGAGQTATGIVNAGFGAVDTTFQNFDQTFMVAPDLDNVRTLVLAAQDSYRQETFDKGHIPASFIAARSVIERYAGLCTYSGMRHLVNASVSGQAQQINSRTNPQSNSSAGSSTEPSQPSAATSPPPAQPAP